METVGHDRGFVTLRLLYLILRTVVGWLGLLTRSRAYAFLQNLRRGFYEFGLDVRPQLRLTTAFTELTRAL